MNWEGHQGTGLPLQELVEQHQCSGYHPNRARRSASREPTTALPNRDEQMDGETQPNQENQPNITAPTVQEVIQPQTDQQGHGNPDDNGGQPASDQSRPPTPNWTGFAPPPNSKKPERMIGEHMKQEKSQVIHHTQEFGIGLM